MTNITPEVGDYKVELSPKRNRRPFSKDQLWKKGECACPWCWGEGGREQTGSSRGGGGMGGACQGPQAGVGGLSMPSHVITQGRLHFRDEETETEEIKSSAQGNTLAGDISGSAPHSFWSQSQCSLGPRPTPTLTSL